MRNYRELLKQSNLMAWGGGKSQVVAENLTSKILLRLNSDNINNKHGLITPKSKINLLKSDNANFRAIINTPISSIEIEKG